MNPILVQMIYYAITMLLTFMFLQLLMQGFPTKFIRVFGSLGKLSFVKIRGVTHDSITIGREDEGFLLFKHNKKMHRLPIPKDIKVFYRFLFCQWIDVDGEKWAISKCDYGAVSGFDPVKIQNFLKRILMQPQTDDNNFKKIYIGLIIIGVLLIAMLVFSFIMYQKIGLLIGIGNELLKRSAVVTAAQI